MSTDNCMYRDVAPKRGRHVNVQGSIDPAMVHSQHIITAVHGHGEGGDREGPVGGPTGPHGSGGDSGEGPGGRPWQRQTEHAGEWKAQRRRRTPRECVVAGRPMESETGTIEAITMYS